MSAELETRWRGFHGETRHRIRDIDVNLGQMEEIQAVIEATETQAVEQGPYIHRQFMRGATHDLEVLFLVRHGNMAIPGVKVGQEAIILGIHLDDFHNVHLETGNYFALFLQLADDVQKGSCDSTLCVLSEWNCRL